VPSSLAPLAIRKRLHPAVWGPPSEFGPAGWLFQNRTEIGQVIVSVADHGDGDWVHASVAFRDRLPDYGELVVLHRAAFGDGYAYQVFAPTSRHVNLHEHALHLWGRRDGTNVLPDFGRYGRI
jgi:hypothetical protein